MWTRLILTALLILTGWVFSSHTVHAACEVHTTVPTYNDLQFVGADLCDANGNKWITPGTLLGGEHVDAVEANGYIRTNGGIVRTTALMTNVTTNTQSATAEVPTGSKVFTANIDGTGAQSVTVTIYGDQTTTAEDVLLLCTITLSATTRDIDACAPTTVNYPYYHAVTASISGTGAAVDVAVDY